MKNNVVVLGIFLFLFAAVSRAASLEDVLAPIPIQAGGRVKPFDTYAREALRLIYGKEKYKNKPATELILTWFLIPEHWTQEPIFQITRRDVKENLRLNPDKSYFSLKELLENSDRLGLQLQEVTNKRRVKEKLNPYFQDIERLESQMGTFDAITKGHGLKFVPSPSDHTWVGLDKIDESMQAKFSLITRALVTGINETGGSDFSGMQGHVTDFLAAAKAIKPGEYPSDFAISTEIHYNQFHPFRWAWSLYLLTTLCFLIFIFSQKIWVHKLGWAFTWIAFFFHCYGFAIRIYLSGRPPVTNMYETVIWVSWGATLFGMIYEKQLKRGYVLFASGIIGTLCLILADMAPTILDASIQPLQPVLRSNSWLLIHVLTITISYAAFFVAFVLGDIGLYYYLRGEQNHKDSIEVISQGAYRTMQVGVVMLAAGTILGGVWADYSWGRFWGWDPKETWALIALLGYIAVLHGRLSGWLRNFGFLAGTIVSFSLVIMAWYGVNYVLGAGLHSYGFGGGGVEYVAAFVGAHFLYVLFVGLVKRGRDKLTV